ATALFVAVGALTGAIATGGAATISFAQTEEQQGGDTTGQEGGQQGAQARIVRTGTVVSTQDPLPGHETHQAATILPLRQDGSVYSGVITYTASAPVEVVIPMVQTLNETEQSLLNVTDDEDGFGTLLTSPLDNQTSIAIHIITPTYGDTPIPSASIPFTGNALWLHTIDGTPFVANYAVSAQVLPAESQNVISNVTIGAAAAEEADAEEADAEEADAADEGADGEDAEGEEDGAADEGGAVGPGTAPA
ncbi:MAG TPA: hypothetical protein VJ643_08020, partial [Nitrososphaera sp.]|nr:hypothetical protein [Nitrososphaera sp.]